jgi:hypothetical protein
VDRVGGDLVEAAAEIQAGMVKEGQRWLDPSGSNRFRAAAPGKIAGGGISGR